MQLVLPKGKVTITLWVIFSFLHVNGAIPKVEILDAEWKSP